MKSKSYLIQYKRMNMPEVIVEEVPKINHLAHLAQVLAKMLEKYGSTTRLRDFERLYRVLKLSFDNESAEMLLAWDEEDIEDFALDNMDALLYSEEAKSTYFRLRRLDGDKLDRT